MNLREIWTVKTAEMLQIDRELTEGRLPLREGEIAVDEGVLKILGSEYGIGSMLVLPTGQRRRSSDNTIIISYSYPFSGNKEENRTEEYFEITDTTSYFITGILKEEFHVSNNYSSGAVAFGDYSQSAKEDAFNMMVLLSDLKDVRKSAQTIAQDAGVSPEKILYNDALLNILGKGNNDGINDTISNFSTILILIIIISTIAVIFNSFNISLIERSEQFSLLRCVGAVPDQIRKIILREALVITVIGVPFGVLLGISAMDIIFAIAGSLSSNLLFTNMETIISCRVIIVSVLVGSVTVFLSALLPAWKSGKIPAVEAIQRTNMHRWKRKKRRPYNLSSNRNFPGFIAVMAVRNIGRNRRRFYITLFSMVISVVLYVSFGGLLRLIVESNVIHDANQPGFLLESTTYIEDNIYNDIKSLDCVETAYKYEKKEVVMPIESENLSQYYLENVDKLSEYELNGSSNFRQINIKIKEGHEKEALVNYLDKLIDKNMEYIYIDVQNSIDKFTRDMQAIELFFNGFIAIIALIGCLNIINTISTDLINRTQELGMLQALGMDRASLGRMVLAESIIYSLWSLLIGGAAGTGLWYLIVNTLGGIRETVFRIPLKELTVAAIALVIISILAGYIPFRRIDSRTIVDKIGTAD